MNNGCIEIRFERQEEQREVENLIRESFWNIYRPGCLEHYLMHIIRDDANFVKDLDFVMCKDGELIGQNIFYKMNLKCDDGTMLPILMMGPICIRNDLKRKGYGKILLDYCLEKASEKGYGAVMFEGNIGFYGKCGFDYASRFGIRYEGIENPEDADFFLCKELKKGYLDGITGEFSSPAIYLVDRDKVEEFDKSFPKKEKLTLPGQLE